MGYDSAPIITQLHAALQFMLIRRNKAVRHRRSALSLLIAATLLLTACVYRVDVQQGNLLEDSDVDAVQIGMTRSQVRFLLGTPIIADTFHQERWDYIYYFRQGRKRKAERQWMIVYFDGDRVSRILKDVPVEPT